MISAKAPLSLWRRHVLSLAIPVMLSNSTVPLVGIVDTAVMGRMGAPEYIAATAVGAVIFSSIYWIFGFLRMATGGLVAQANGRGDSVDMGRICVRAMIIGVFFSTVLLILQTPLLKLGLAAMQDNSTWQALTSEYFHIRILSAPATLLNYVILGTLIGMQRMRGVLMLQLVLNLINICLNIAFFHYTDWDIAGVALATVISEYITLILGLWLIRAVILDTLSAPHWQQGLFSRGPLLRYFQISRDLFIRTLCLTFAFYMMTVMSSWQGVLILAANTVLLQMVHFASYCMDGFSDACEALTGYATGRKDREILSKATRSAAEAGLLSASVFSLVYFTLGDNIIALMTLDPATRNTAELWLPWVIAAPLIGIWSFLLDGIFIGATQTASMRNSMLISLAAFLLTALVCVPLTGNTGIWIAYMTMLIMRTLTLALAWPRIIEGTLAS